MSEHDEPALAEIRIELTSSTTVFGRTLTPEPGVSAEELAEAAAADADFADPRVERGYIVGERDGERVLLGEFHKTDEPEFQSRIERITACFDGGDEIELTLE